MQRQRQSSSRSGAGRDSAPRTNADAGTEARVAEIGQRHGFSPEATLGMWRALVAGRGGMAQFAHGEFGGAGQWMRGGMLMVGDMFNHGLKGRVGALCEELAQFLATQPTAGAGALPAGPGDGGGDWWPPELNGPATSGAQNGVRYAWFPVQRRLAIERDGVLELYDTADHRIGGVSQQQGGTHGLAFTSQHGPLDLATLRRVDSHSPAAPQRAAPPSAAAAPAPMPTPRAGTGAGTAGDATTVLDTLDRLAALHGRGVLTDEEFRAKKAELLARL